MNYHTPAESLGTEPRARHYRSIWISDIHLGTRGCQADLLLDFLKYNESDHLYLVGDIIDGWRMRRSWYWTQSHNDVVQKILRKARKGTNVTYITGNHDDCLRYFSGSDMMFGSIHLTDEMMHQTADGKKLWIIHGDRFDGVVKHAKWLAVLGDVAYTFMLGLNTVFNMVRRYCGMGYWSLSSYVKGKVKNAVEFISSFETTLAEEARRHGADGVVCGHIHKAEMRDIDGILYCNDGDWVESCTALVEHMDGQLEIIEWASVRAFDRLARKTRAAVATPAPAQA
ncbi:MAG TPA: UDP-2,3-diacylglucosamine diphosphatase [Stellaceae bacterium]|nr:UDP-2,3-diacylglucosamine diphosphatase [Stellaceae bacterium]